MGEGLARLLRQVKVHRMELDLQTQPRTMQTYASSGGRDVEDHSDLRRGQLLPGPQSQDLGVGRTEPTHRSADRSLRTEAVIDRGERIRPLVPAGSRPPFVARATSLAALEVEQLACCDGVQPRKWTVRHHLTLAPRHGEDLGDHVITGCTEATRAVRPHRRVVATEEIFQPRLVARGVTFLSVHDPLLPDMGAALHVGGRARGETGTLGPSPTPPGARLSGG